MMSSIIKPVKLAYKIFEPSLGVKHDVPIIFLHALSTSKEHWHEIPQIAADGTGRKVYAVDARDHGDSEWSDSSSFSSDVNVFDVNTIDILHFLEEIKAERAILVGHSMGGMITISTALEAPAKFEKIILEDAGMKKVSNDRLNGMALYQQLAQRAIKAVPPDTSEREAKQIIGDFIYHALPEEMKPFAISRENDPRIILKQNSDGSWDYKTNFKGLENILSKGDVIFKELKGVYTGPACFIYGKNSPYKVNEDEEMIKTHFPNAQFMGIEATHNVHTDAPVLFTEALIKFIKE